MGKGAIGLLWILAGAIVVLRTTMQFTTFGGSRQPSPLQNHASTAETKTATRAYNYYAQQYQRSQTNQASNPSDGFGKSAFGGTALAILLGAVSNIYVAGIFFLITLVLTAILHFTYRTGATQPQPFNTGRGGWQGGRY